jgi:hypothetical protein
VLVRGHVDPRAGNPSALAIGLPKRRDHCRPWWPETPDGVPHRGLVRGLASAPDKGVDTTASYVRRYHKRLQDNVCITVRRHLDNGPESDARLFDGLPSTAILASGMTGSGQLWPMTRNRRVDPEGHRGNWLPGTCVCRSPTQGSK